MSAELWFDKTDGVATITLNRPEKRNAFTESMLADWAGALHECQADDSIGAVIVTGSGTAFCAGGDLATMGDVAGDPAEYIGTYLRQNVHPVARAVMALEKPYIAAVNGVAAGAGMDMALMADVRFAAQSARFLESYIKVGLIPGDGGAYLLPRIVGASKALELLWTGESIDATEAIRLGIASRLYEDSQLVEATHAFAEQLATGPRIAIRLVKHAVRAASDSSDLMTALDAIVAPMGVAFNTNDHREAVVAFAERRQPIFRGS